MTAITPTFAQGDPAGGAALSEIILATLNAWALVHLATVIEDAAPGSERFRRTPTALEPVPAA